MHRRPLDRIGGIRKRDQPTQRVTRRVLQPGGKKRAREHLKQLIRDRPQNPRDRDPKHPERQPHPQNAVLTGSQRRGRHHKHNRDHRRERHEQTPATEPPAGSRPTRTHLLMPPNPTMIAAPIPALIAMSCARVCPIVNSRPTTASARPMNVATNHLTLSVRFSTNVAIPPIDPLLDVRPAACSACAPAPADNTTSPPTAITTATASSTSTTREQLIRVTEDLLGSRWGEDQDSAQSEKADRSRAQGSHRPRSPRAASQPATLRPPAWRSQPTGARPRPRRPGSGAPRADLKPGALPGVATRRVAGPRRSPALAAGKI